jgi:hypothetical protein
MSTLRIYGFAISRTVNLEGSPPGIESPGLNFRRPDTGSHFKMELWGALSLPAQTQRAGVGTPAKQASR